ncbi:hypothetical protein QUF75_15880 [Desulfococcaceae bacterium HSG7]|nr:hypothetical protein [Desulfococcaceae bacterium HSG7]
MDAYSPEDIGEIQYIVYYNQRDFYTLTYNQIKQLNSEIERAIIKKEDEAYKDKKILKFSSQKAVQKAIVLFKLKINVYFKDEYIQLTHKQIAAFNKKYQGGIKRIAHPQFGKCFTFSFYEVAQAATMFFNLTYRVFEPDSRKYLELSFRVIESINRYHENAISKIERSEIQGFASNAVFNTPFAINTALELMKFSKKNAINPGDNLVEIPDLAGNVHILDKLAFQYGHQIGTIYVPPGKQDLTFAGLSVNNQKFRDARFPSLLKKYLARSVRIIDLDEKGEYHNEYILSPEALKAGYFAGLFRENRDGHLIFRDNITIKNLIEEMRYEQILRTEMFDTIMDVALPQIHSLIRPSNKNSSSYYEEVSLSEEAIRFGFINNHIFANEDGYFLLPPEKTKEELEKFSQKPSLYKILEINNGAIVLDNDLITDAYNRCKRDHDYYRENSYNIERAYNLLMNDDLSFFYLNSGDNYLNFLDKYAPTPLGSKSYQFIILFKP